tara:strand:- start:3031 stop:3540 length:510 start_codon:yes stop_codon:yes gene_type:complete
MAYEKLQGYLALEAIPSDQANIPYPALLMTGQTTAVGKAIPTPGVPMEDANGGFETTNKVYAGDIVYFAAQQRAATVIDVISDTELVLNNAAGQAASQDYVIYQASSYLNLQDANNGCVLYVGGSGDLKVDTISGSTVTFKAVPIGFFPVQVKKVYGTGTNASSIIALW